MNSLKHISNNKIMTDNFVNYTAKKMKNTQQDAEAKVETTQDHAKGKHSSETPNKAKIR